MKKRIMALILIMAMLPIGVFAKTNYQFGQNIVVEENYNSSIMIASQDTEVNNDVEIDGISIIASNSINLEGKTDYLVSASDNIKIRGEVLNDAFVTTNKLSLYGNLKRDLYAFANNVYLSNKIDGNIKIYAATVKFENIIISKNVTICANEIEIGKNVVIKGTLNYNDNAIINGLEKAEINKIKTYKEKVVDVSVGTKILEIIVSTLSYFIIGFLLLYLSPKLFNKKDVDFKYLGIGALLLLLIPFLIVFMMIIPFTITLSFIIMGIYILLIYLSGIITSFILGNYLNTKILHNNESNYISLIIGIIAIQILSLIPIFGGFLVLIFTLYGMGYIFSNFKK